MSSLASCRPRPIPSPTNVNFLLIVFGTDVDRWPGRVGVQFHAKAAILRRMAGAGRPYFVALHLTTESASKGS